VLQAPASAVTAADLTISSLAILLVILAFSFAVKLQLAYVFPQGGSVTDSETKLQCLSSVERKSSGLPMTPSLAYMGSEACGFRVLDFIFFF
jgi:hypothetical protein